MNITITLSQTEESRLTAAARQTGLAPAELIKRLALEHLSSLTNLPANADEETDAISAKLRLWQQQDGTPLMPDIPTATLFAEWAKEDAAMTDEEREAEDHLWKGLEKDLIHKQGVHLRQLGS